MLAAAGQQKAMPIQCSAIPQILRSSVKRISKLTNNYSCRQALLSIGTSPLCGWGTANCTVSRKQDAGSASLCWFGEWWDPKLQSDFWALLPFSALHFTIERKLQVISASLLIHDHRNQGGILDPLSHK